MEKAKAASGAKHVAIYGLCSAVVCVATILIRIPGISQNGYVNFGDAFIFLFGILFGPLAGLISGGLGSAIADLIGYPVFAPFTLVIKGLEGLLVGLIAHRLFVKSENKHAKFGFAVLAMVLASLEMIALYFFASSLLAGSWAAGLAEIVANLIQGGVSTAIAAVILFTTNLSSSVLGACSLSDPLLCARKKDE